MKNNILIDIDAFIMFRTFKMLDLIMQNFKIIITNILFGELIHHIKKEEIKRYKDVFQFVELTNDEKEFNYKIIKKHISKDAAKNFRRDKFKDYPGEIDAITLANSRNIIFITLNHATQITAFTFKIKPYNIESFIEDFVKNHDTNLYKELKRKFIKAKFKWPFLFK